MTPLEVRLLAAFDELSAEHEKQHADSVEAGKTLRKLFEITRAENAELQRQVQALSAQVERLSALLTPSSSSGSRSPGGQPSRRP